MNTIRKFDQNRRVAEAITNRKDIERIRINLRDNPRDLLLFDLATQTGIGMKKLLQLKVRHLIGVEAGGNIGIKESTNNRYSIVMTDIVHETFNKYLKKVGPKPDDYLFKSQKGLRPLNLTSVSNMINGWFEAANIKGCYGAISLRKTWQHNQGNKIHVDKDISPPEKRAIFKPFEITTTQQKIYKELLQAIISRKIPPGSRITTAEISKAFNVSHAPVRVALNWLEAKGFIKSHKKKGSIVRELTIEESNEMVKIRIILEIAAAKLAYKVCTEETLNMLESIIEHYKNAYTFEEADQLNRLFHQTLYRDINMPNLIILITDLYDRFSPYAALASSRTSYTPEHDIIKKNHPHSTYYHKKILEGMRRKDLGEVLKNLKLKLNRASLYTEEALKQAQEPRSE